MERVFDICHGCRRCFNLCESFPRLFDLVDASPTGEIDGVAKADFGQVVEACTLCDMCFMTKCPYVPPHEWALDFPHLMLRHRAAELKRNGQAAALGTSSPRPTAMANSRRLAAPVANFASARGNWATRPLMEAVLGVDQRCGTARISHQHVSARAALEPPRDQCRWSGAGAQGGALRHLLCRLQPTFSTGTAAQAVLAHQGVETNVVYPACCGMPQLEHGDIAEVAAPRRTSQRRTGSLYRRGL